MRDPVRLRRRAAGRRTEPRLAIIDTQTVKCIPVRGPRGFDAAERTLGRNRVAMVDADGHRLALPSSRPRSRRATPCPRSTSTRRPGPACGWRSSTAPSPPSAAANGLTCTACATKSSRDRLASRALSCCLGEGWLSEAWAGSHTATACCVTVPGASTSRRPASPAPTCSPPPRPSSTQPELHQTSFKADRLTDASFKLVWRKCFGSHSRVRTRIRRQGIQKPRTTNSRFRKGEGSESAIAREWGAGVWSRTGRVLHRSSDRQLRQAEVNSGGQLPFYLISRLYKQASTWPRPACYSPNSAPCSTLVRLTHRCGIIETGAAS